MYTLSEPTSFLPAVAILVAAALLHASFQVAASVLTLLSGHSLGYNRSHNRLLRLCISYVAGNILMISLLLLGALYILSAIYSSLTEIWSAIAILGIITGISSLLLYYRGRQARIWMPTGAVQYLYERSKVTKRSFEAFGLGLVTGIAELPFIATPLLFAAMILRGQPDVDRLGAAFGYALIACLPLLFLLALIGSGKKINELEKWREQNRRFIQIMSSIGLVILSCYAFVLYSVTDGGMFI